MPNAGDKFTVVVKKAHIEWGTHRYTHTRDRIYGEGYVKIPASIARQFDIRKGQVFNCTSSDGFIDFSIKAAGNSRKGEIHAKQFQGNGDLKALGRWYRHCNAEIGDIVEVEFTSEDSINLTLKKNNV